MGTSKFNYKQDADTVFAFVSDPDAVRERSIAMGERDIVINKTGETVHNVRTVDADVPGFAKKVLKPTNTIDELKEWNSANRTGKLTVDVKGAPTKILGDIKITPNPAGGCVYQVDFRVECNIPLIGKKIAQYVDGVTAKGMQEEFEYNQAKLDELG